MTAYAVVVSDKMVLNFEADEMIAHTEGYLALLQERVVNGELTKVPIFVAAPSQVLAIFEIQSMIPNTGAQPAPVVD